MFSALFGSARYWKTENKGNHMNTEQHFLIKYGLHNFVTCARTSGKQVFFIRSTESQNMTNHAQHLIKEGFGETVDIRII